MNIESIMGHQLVAANHTRVALLGRIQGIKGKVRVHLEHMIEEISPTKDPYNWK